MLRLLVLRSLRRDFPNAFVGSTRLTYGFEQEDHGNRDGSKASGRTALNDIY